VGAYLIGDRSQFDRVRADAAHVFDLGSQLPGPVCRLPDVRTFWFEDAIVASGRFGVALQRLASLHGDQTVGLLVLAPDAVDDYYRHFQLYGAFALPIGAGAGAYWDALTEAPAGSDADAILYNANRWVAAGESRRWGVWYERPGVELAAVFSQDTPGLADWQSSLPDAPLGIADALAIVELARGRPVPDAVERALRDNWGRGT
jgi:hypothetical protein